MNSEQLQKEHFDRIFLQYKISSDNLYHQRYLSRFIFGPAFEGITLSGKKVLDAMCSTGQATQCLLSKGAILTALDISEAAMDYFKKSWPNCSTICASILNSKLESNSFDCVVVMGGLHHLHPHVDKAIEEIYRVLKLGGYFCFVEPHSGSLPDLFRKIWYKYDNLFAENEASIDLEALKNKYSSYFKYIKERYSGSIAFLFVSQSMFLRIPLRLRSIYSPLLLYLESMIDNFQGKLLSCVVICQWQKK